MLHVGGSGPVVHRIAELCDQPLVYLRTFVGLR